MVRLSVNVNKIATLRNSRAGQTPSVLEAVDVCLAVGVTGITVHPRADERHITARDVEVIAERLVPLRETVEFNVEGDPRADLIERVVRLRPHQCTLVPVRPGEITSEAGWRPDVDGDLLRSTIARLQAVGVRVSLFVEADAAPIEWAAKLGADRVELYTEPYARACEHGEIEASLARFAAAAELAHELGLGVNAGHDLDLVNLPRFAELPHLDEVSIGHALISRAVFVGLATVCREYLAILAQLPK